MSYSTCCPCGFDVTKGGEIMMIHDDLWDPIAADDDLLCIGCIEERLGRRLIEGDFTSSQVNREPRFRSERLLSRLGALVGRTTVAGWVWVPGPLYKRYGTIQWFEGPPPAATTAP